MPTHHTQVISLSFGNYANHVGAHFWNSEEELRTLEEPSEVDPS
jgi:hypothetical protein